MTEDSSAVRIRELERENQRLRLAIQMAINSVGDLKSGFSKSVDPERWVEQLQTHLNDELRK